MIFCVKFNAADLPENLAILVGLAIVQDANLSSWMKAHVDEAFPSTRNYTCELAACFDADDINVSDHSRRCLNRSTDDHELVNSVRAYLGPFTAQYLLMVIAFVALWFFRAVERNDAERAASWASTIVAWLWSPVSLLRSLFVGQPGYEPVGDRPRPPVNRWWVFVSVISSTIASFVHVILGARRNVDIGAVNHYVFQFSRGIYWLALTLVALAGYRASRTFRRAPIKPDGFEYFVILTCVGPMMHAAFSFVDVDASKDFPEKAATFAKVALHMLQVCVQILFYRHAKMTQMPTVGDNQQNEGAGPTCRRCSVLLGAMLYFVVCNFALWIDSSFVETATEPHSEKKQYFDNWPLVYSIFNPLTSLFRINSALLFVDALLDKQRPENLPEAAAAADP